MNTMRLLCQDIVELRRGDHGAERLRLDLDRFAEANKEEQIRALEIILEDTKQWPDVRKAIKMLSHVSGNARPGRSNQIKVNHGKSSQQCKGD